jgi:protease-4
VRGLWEKIGFSYDDLAFAPNAFLLSELHDYTEEQWRRIDEVHWKFYNDWIADIASARGLSFEQVDEAGQGKVWTGRQAKDRELVDDLGGFDMALEQARRLADLDEGEKVTIVHYPEKQTVVDLLLRGELGMAFAQGLVHEAREALFETVPRNLTLQHLARFRVE